MERCGNSIETLVVLIQTSEKIRFLCTVMPLEVFLLAELNSGLFICSPARLSLCLAGCLTACLSPSA